MIKTQKHWKGKTLLFLISQCITLFGSQIVQMAIVWYVTLRTDSGAWVAAFSVCAYLPQFFMSFIGGVWADRYSRKRLIIGADMLIAVVTLLMLLAMPYITEDLALLRALLCISVLRAIGAGVQSPAVGAVIVQLVPQDQLMRYNGVNAAMQSLVQFAAPAAAAAALSASSLSGTLAVDMLTAVVGVGLFACIALPKQPCARKAPSVLADIGAGVRYAYAVREIRNSLIVYGLFLFFTVPAGYLSGLLVSRVFGDTYWYLTAVELVGFGGMMAGGLLMSVWGGFHRHKHTLATGLVLFGAMAAAMGMSHRFSLYLACMAVYGIALTMVQTTITTLLQKNTEAAMQGRILGLMSALYAGCYPLGMAIFGPMADAVRLQVMMVFSGAALMVLAGWAFCTLS